MVCDEGIVALAGARDFTALLKRTGLLLLYHSIFNMVECSIAKAECGIISRA